MSELSMVLLYMDLSVRFPESSYPYVLEVDAEHVNELAMVPTEFRALVSLVKEQTMSGDYLIDDTARFVSFRKKSDAMRIKLMWKPIQWTPVGPPGW